MKKFTDYFEIISVSLVVLVLSAAFFLLPDKATSENENRSLASAPQFSLSALADGSYTSELGGYFADQFPMRDLFVGGKAYSELFQLKGENNGVINVNDVLIPRPTNDTSALSSNAKVIDYFADAVSVPVTVAALPRTADVYAELLPGYYPAEDDEALLTSFKEAMSEANVALPDLITTLCESNDYYRTDHHYTTEGAYKVYCALAQSLGYTPYERSFFTSETVTEDFCGTAMRTSGFYMTAPDEIVLYRYDGDDGYTVTADGEEISLYDFDKLNVTDKYALFLGGNHARVDVVGEQERPKLLLVRDSFADSIAPFLALHFDLIMIDYRYFNGSAVQMIESENVSQVLILEGINELCEVKNLSYLAKGVKK